MLARITETVLSATCSQICVGEKQQNSRGQSVAVVWLYDQSIFAVNDNFGNIADPCRDDWPAAGERFAQNNRRRFSVARRDYDHVRSRKNVRNVPAISHHQHIPVQTGAVDCFAHPFFPAPAASGFADENKMRVRPLLTHNPRGFH